jgi:hypothetical protein
MAQPGTNGAITAIGTANWTTDFALDPGTNMIRAWAVDTSGNLSLTNTRTIFFAVRTPLSLTVNGNGAVASLTNNQLLEVGQSYSLKATPALGNLFSNWIVGGVTVTGSVLNFTRVAAFSSARPPTPPSLLSKKCAGETLRTTRANLFVTPQNSRSFWYRLLAAPAAEANPFFDLHGGKHRSSHDGDAEPGFRADGRGVE